MTVFISGAGGGLGRALAVVCAQRGYDLFLTDRRLKNLEEIRQGIFRQYPVAVEIKECDLTVGDDISATFRSIDEKGLSFDMLLNVAGVDHEGEFTRLSCGEILEMVSLNVGATLLITHEILSRRKEGAPFYIVNVSSLGSMYPMPLKATYAASKRFLLDFTYALGQELRADGVNVMALCPAGLPTTQQSLTEIAAQGFWGRITTCRLEEVAQKTVQKSLSGKRIYIPGLINNLFCGVGSLIPKSLVVKILHARWHKARNRHVRAETV